LFDFDFCNNLVRGLENCLHDSNHDVIALALRALSQAQSLDIPLGQDCATSLTSVLCGKLLHGKTDAISQSAASCVSLLILVQLTLTDLLCCIV
jgi:hypothetical protein